MNFHRLEKTDQRSYTDLMGWKEQSQNVKYISLFQWKFGNNG